MSLTSRSDQPTRKAAGSDAVTGLTRVPSATQTLPQEPFTAQQGQNEHERSTRGNPASSSPQVTSDLRQPRRRHRATRRNEGLLPSGRHAHRSRNCLAPDLPHAAPRSET